ncbi:hypothetical protein TNCV_815941 [Trichonephila clavipes]|nr:hypothetical protein TNCV_815941 [Trichonephila clavipes]
MLDLSDFQRACRSLSSWSEWNRNNSTVMRLESEGDRRILKRISTSKKRTTATKVTAELNQHLDSPASMITVTRHYHKQSVYSGVAIPKSFITDVNAKRYLQYCHTPKTYEIDNQAQEAQVSSSSLDQGSELRGSSPNAFVILQRRSTENTWEWSGASHLSAPSTNHTRGLAARRLFIVPPCREDTIHLQTSISSPGFEPRPNGTAVSAANHYTGWATHLYETESLNSIFAHFESSD